MPDEKTMVGQIQQRLDTLRSEWAGRPLAFEDVVAHTVFWGAILTKYYPEALEAAQLLIGSMQVVGETYQRGEEKKRWN